MRENGVISRIHRLLEGESGQDGEVSARILPVAKHLNAIRESFPFCIIQAPPGTGKTTIVPPLLAKWILEKSRVRNIDERNENVRTVDAGAEDALTPDARLEDSRSADSRPAVERVIVTQPRRVAVRAVARRIAQLLGEKVGETVGYTVRAESVTSPRTLIEIMTPGVLLRHLQTNPELVGISAIVFDEVHERHLISDLTLACCLETASLREDLAIVVMSATMDTGKIEKIFAETLGTPPEIVNISADIHPLHIRYCPPARGDEALGVISREGATGVRKEFLGHVARICVAALQETATGDVLVFLPGVREVDNVVDNLRSLCGNTVDIYPLHGGMTAREQDKVLDGNSDTRRVIVSTAIAESSLTVPGVRIVVDGGLSREPREDIARGISGLVTVMESQASGIQRAGRAARLGPGIAYRCMSENTWARLAAHSEPEIRIANLTDFVLNACVWAGSVDGIAQLPLLDQPPTVAVQAACHTLRSLGIMDGEGTIPDGALYAQFPSDVRLARAMFETEHIVGRKRVAQYAAALADKPRIPGADFTQWRKYVGSDWAYNTRRFEKELRRREREISDGVGGDYLPAFEPGNSSRHASQGYLTEGQSSRRNQTQSHSSRRNQTQSHSSRHHSSQGHQIQGDNEAGMSDTISAKNHNVATREKDSSPVKCDNATALALVIANAYPENIAQRRPRTSRYLLANGTGAVLPENSPLEGEEWLAIADISSSAGKSDALIRAAVPLTKEMALSAGANLRRKETEIYVAGRTIHARTRELLGNIEISSLDMQKVDAAEARTYLIRALKDGEIPLVFTDEAEKLRQRIEFLRRECGDSWPDVSNEFLITHVEEWAGIEIDAASRGKEWASVTAEMLMRLLPWPLSMQIDELAPARIQVPTGDTRQVDYSKERPVVRLRVQEAFGWKNAPLLAGGKVRLTLELLSPAQRPLAVTDDLRGFWEGSYVQVRAEMRGRYPRHPWPEDALNAQPTRRAKKKRDAN
ncbi:ATP-dependent RNA helicase [Actinotignum urinale]|uniref:ATP-dependent helicase C-terminal domain-containing protein n=1 Tax=Actinotignum urinale TaxID=190146 RepID=A0AAW9HNK2_9ACTO|nr:ATP-dependent helicase C-terminal domain-containing protein [Actinotignum urinale]MDY5155493.1 ATP-dependent helicase C-terminal domain-containing protein [Actinotignum urinale]